MSISAIAPRRWTPALVALTLSAAVLPAQTVVVTGDGSTFTSPAGPPGAVDPTCAALADTWCARNVRANAEVGITADFPRSGNGSLYFESASSAAKADFEIYFSSPFTLGQVESLAYDYFRSSASTNAANQVPSLRLILGATAGGYLIYEPVYNGGAFAVDTWHTATIGGTSTFWLNGHGSTFLTLDQWRAGVVLGGRTVDANTQVIGLSTGVGSGWANAFVGAVDNVSYETTGMQQAVTYNFEVSSVPEPQTYALMATGLLGVAAAAYGRRRGARA